MSESALGRPGQIEVICGPMFSGKTEELIRRLKRAQIARQKVWVFKPGIDDRYDAIQIVSHSAQKLLSIPVADEAGIEERWRAPGPRPEVVGIDEAQFFGSALIPLLEEMAESGVRVVAAGLDLDYLGKPFGVVPELLAVAESVTKQSAVCMVCGAPASRSQRVHPRAADLFLRGQGTAPEDVAALDEAQILVGATQDYEARCRTCFVKTIDTPTAASREPEEF